MDLFGKHYKIIALFPKKDIVVWRLHLLNGVSAETGALLALFPRSSFIGLSTEYTAHSSPINKSGWGQGEAHLGPTHLNAVSKQRN